MDYANLLPIVMLIEFVSLSLTFAWGITDDHIGAMCIAMLNLASLILVIVAYNL